MKVFVIGMVHSFTEVYLPSDLGLFLEVCKKILGNDIKISSKQGYITIRNNPSIINCVVNLSNYAMVCSKLGKKGLVDMDRTIDNVREVF